MRPSSATKSPPSPSSVAETPEEAAEPSGTAAWHELLALYRDEAGEVSLQDRLLGLWAREHGAAAAGLYLAKDGLLHQEAATGPGLPVSLDESAFDAEPGPFRSLRFPDGRLVYAPRD